MGLSYEQLLAYIQGLYDEGGLSEEDYNRVILYILANGNIETSPRDLIQVRRGLEENLPNLAQGELGFTLDTEKFFVGGLEGNVEIKTDIDFDFESFDSFITHGDITDFLTQDNQNIVLTGDSLSFNYHDFLTTNVDNTSYKNFPGLMSWAHILRDSIYRHDPFFVEGFKIYPTINANVKNIRYGVASDFYTFAMNNNNCFPTFTKENENTAIKFTYKHSNKNNKAVLLLSKLPSTFACKFDIYVNGELKVSNVDTGGEVDFYRGFEMFQVIIDGVLGNGIPQTIELKNFRNSDFVLNTDGRYGVLIYGISTKVNNIFLTGEGGARSGFILTNISDRILSKNPRFVAMILGANDAFHNVPVETYKNNIQEIINLTRNQNSNTKFLLMGSPSMGHPNTPDHVVREYNDALKSVAIDNLCYYVDLQDLFKNIDIAFWRHDLVHLNKTGSGILSKTVLDVLCSKIVKDNKLIDTRFYYAQDTEKPFKLLSMDNNWVNVSTYQPLSYTKENNKVHITGVITGGTRTPGTVIATLPDEIKPNNFYLCNISTLDGTTVTNGMVALTTNIVVSHGVEQGNVAIDITYTV